MTTVDVDAALADAAREYLVAKRCTLWQTFNVQTRSGLNDAVEFIVGLVNDMNEQR